MPYIFLSHTPSENVIYYRICGSGVHKKGVVSYIARPKRKGIISEKSLAQELSLRTGIKKIYIERILLTFFDLLPYYLIQGYNIKITKLLSLRLMFHSKAVARAEDFTPEHIKDIVISAQFLPHTKAQILKYKREALKEAPPEKTKPQRRLPQGLALYIRQKRKARQKRKLREMRRK